MKKIAKLTLFCAIAVALSTVSIGCSSDGSSSFCKTGSLWPTSRTKKKTETVYMASAADRNCEVGYCSPCEPAACNPCDPACAPCEPLCDPCAMNGMSGVISSGIIPGPAGN